MGLHERIKNSLAATGKDTTNTRTADKDAKNTPARRESAKPEENSKPGRSPQTSKHGSKKPRTQNKAGLPPLKKPSIPKGHRALLVACSRTGRASWAVLKEHNASGSFSFVRNLRAVPDPEAANKPAPKGEPTKTGPELCADIPMERVDLSGYTCGVCGADGATGSLFVRCGDCHTLQCRPEGSWDCPACGSHITRVGGSIGSVSGAEGSEDPPPARAGLSAGPGREALTSAAPAKTDTPPKTTRRRK